MKKEVFLEKMADIMETEDSLTMDRILADIDEWDSLSLVGFISMVNVECGKRLSVEQVKQAEKIRDLYAMVEN